MSEYFASLNNEGRAGAAEIGKKDLLGECGRILCVIGHYGHLLNMVISSVILLRGLEFIQRDSCFNGIVLIVAITVSEWHITEVKLMTSNRANCLLKAPQENLGQKSPSHLYQV